MALFISGFNGFRAINSTKRYLLKCSDDDNQTEKSVVPSCFEFQTLKIDDTIPVYKIAISWSFIIYVRGETLSLCGFQSSKTNAVHSFEIPNKCSIHQLSCNRGHVVCITSDGGCWQLNLDNRLWRDLSPILSSQEDPCDDDDNKSVGRRSFAKVCCGETITAVLTNRGEVFNIPNKLVLPGVKIIDVACGRSHIIMLSENGEVYSTGEGSRGQLGRGELEDEEEPKPVDALAGLRVVAVACGGWHSCALTAEGDLYTWGWDFCGQLGLGGKECKSKVSVQALPQVVDWPDKEDVRVLKVACGARHTVAVLDDGSVWGCGWNKYGQLALTGVESVDCMTRLPITSQEFKDVICGPWNTCLVA